MFMIALAVSMNLAMITEEQLMRLERTVEGLESLQIQTKPVLMVSTISY